MEKSKDKLKDRLAAARLKAGYSGAQVARAVGMSQPSYSDLEKGIAKGSTKIVEIADFLRVRYRWLVFGIGEGDLREGLSVVEMELLEIFRSGTRTQKMAILKLVSTNRDTTA